MLRRNSPLIWAGLVYVVKSLASDQENRLQVPEPAPKRKFPADGEIRHPRRTQNPFPRGVWVQVPLCRLHFCYVKYIVV